MSGISVALLLVAYVGLSQYYLRDSRYRLLQDRLQISQADATRLDDFFSRGAARLNVIAQLPLLLNGLAAITQNPGQESLPAQDTLHYLVYKSDIFMDGVYLLNS